MTEELHLAGFSHGTISRNSGNGKFTIFLKLRPLLKKIAADYTENTVGRLGKKNLFSVKPRPVTV